LVETPVEPPAAKADAGTVERLTARILAKARSGIPVERAVAEGCREVLGAPAQPAPQAEKGESKLAPCPLCGAPSPEDAEKCGGCGLWFDRLRSPQPCPRCERGVKGDGQCECGAILTLPKLLDYIEPAVRWVCVRCRAPYAVAQPKCPDCGGGLISAERIKAFAAS
jgi:ribosomal protein L40E